MQNKCYSRSSKQEATISNVNNSNNAKTSSLYRLLITVQLVFVGPLLGACSYQEKTPTYASLKLSKDGSAVAFIRRHSEKSEVLVSTTGSRNPRIMVGVNEYPIDLTFAESSDSILMVTAKVMASKVNPVRNLTEYSIVKQTKVNEIYSAEGLGSPVYISKDDYAFLSKSESTPNGRNILRWHRKIGQKEAEEINAKPFGYRFNASLITDIGIIFLYETEKDGRSSPYLEFIPLKSGTKLPERLHYHISESTVDYGCNRDASVCFQLEKYTEQGRSNYLHRLTIFEQDISCAVQLPRQWIETSSISADGSTVAFIGASPSSESNPRKWPRTLTKLHSKVSLCNNGVSIEQTNVENPT